MLENDPLRRVTLPRTLTHSRLFRQSHARRLFKARHLALEQLEIRTRIVSVTSEECVAPATVYAVRARPVLLQRRRDSRAELTPWVVEHRYSEHHAFRQWLLRRIKEWEDTAADEEKETKEFMAMSNALRRPITPDFPRRHLRVDTVKIIEERRVGLQDFVKKLITAYVDVSVYLHEYAPSMSAQSHAQMTALCHELEEFLDVPESQKEMERYLTAAIRALEDVDEEEKPEEGGIADGTEGYECCICMNADETLRGPNGRLPGDDKLVRLPCSHSFHEDCVIDWFSTSMTCPLCRQLVVRAEPSLSLDSLSGVDAQA